MEKTNLAAFLRSTKAVQFDYRFYWHVEVVARQDDALRLDSFASMVSVHLYNILPAIWSDMQSQEDRSLHIATIIHSDIRVN